MRILKSTPRVKFTRNSKLRGGGKNSATRISGARGRRVRIPRTADSFKSRTDNT